MDEQPVTRETLREFLTNHRNWAETSPDVFECCIENPCWPSKIELDEVGAWFTFRKDATGDWAFMAGQTRRCPYSHIHVVPLDSYSDYAGSVMIDVRVQVLPPGQPRPEKEPMPPLGPRINIFENDPEALAALQRMMKPRPPDWPELDPPQ